MFLFMIPMLIDEIPLPPKPVPVVVTTTTTTTRPLVIKAIPKPKPKPLPTTTTTTTLPPKTFLSVVQEQVGRTPQEIGISPDFWCAVFVEWALTQVGWEDTDSTNAPSWLRNKLPATDSPEPGDLVFFSFQDGSGQADHVAVVESVNPLIIIDGNGLSRTNVLRGAPRSYEIAGYAKTPPM